MKIIKLIIMLKIIDNYIHIYIYIYIYVCMYIYIYIYLLYLPILFFANMISSFEYIISNL